jgi:hypothetical protein
MVRRLLDLALLAGLCIAQSSYEIKETHILPRDFTYEGDAPPDHMLRLHIGLTQGRFEELERKLYEGMFHTTLTTHQSYTPCTNRKKHPIPTTFSMASISALAKSTSS